MSMQQKPEGAVLIFVLGILSLVSGCFPLGIIAWVMGSGYTQRCRMVGVEPEGIAVAGKIIGMIVTVLTVLVILFYLALLALGIGLAAVG